MILDINGYLVAASNTSALAFYPMPPCRLVDTRNGKLCYKLFLIPGELTRPQNRPVLRLRPSPMIENLAETIYARASRLTPLQS